MKNLLFFILFIYSCSNKSPIENTQKSLALRIDFTEILKDKKTITISDLADSVEYIFFETHENSLLGKVLDAKFTRKYIFLNHSGSHLLAQYDRKGNFIRHIGKNGRGPKEYPRLNQFSVDEKNQLIYISTSWMNKILVYNFNGKYLNTLKIKFAKGCHGIEWLSDSTFIQYSPVIFGTEKSFFIHRNQQGDTLQTVDNTIFWETEVKYANTRHYFGRKIFYKSKNQLHFKSWYNDTVYVLNADYKITPKYFIDLGNYKLPNELRPERILSKQIPEKYLWLSVCEVSNYLVIKYSSYDSPNLGKLPGGYVLFNKNSKQGYVNNNKDALRNDLDGGPDFIPEFATDTSLFCFISALDFKKHFETTKLKDKNHPSKINFLSEKVNNLDYQDNHVLMVLNFKK